jgi:hypothetical protein
MTTSIKSTSARKNELQSPVPEVVCPRCRSIMRLATIEPMVNSGDNRMLFECSCGVAFRRPEVFAQTAPLDSRV